MKHKKTMLSLFISLLIASSSSPSSANGLSVEELADQKFAEMRSVIQADLRSGGTGGLGGWWGPELTAELERRGYQEKWNEIYEEERAKFKAEQAAQSIENQETTVTNQPQTTSAEEKANQNSSVKSTDTNKSELKILPKTSDATSRIAIFGVLMSLLGLAGLEKQKRRY